MITSLYGQSSGMLSNYHACVTMMVSKEHEKLDFELVQRSCNHRMILHGMRNGMRRRKRTLDLKKKTQLCILPPFKYNSNCKKKREELNPCEFRVFQNYVCLSNVMGANVIKFFAKIS